MTRDKLLAVVAVLLLLGTPAAAAERPLWALTEFLARSDGATDHLAIAVALDELRAMKHQAAPAAETLSSLLPHRAKLYHDRDKVLVVRLRAHIMVTLSEIGFPISAEWALLDTLGHVDERISAREVGAAARAARSLGPRGRELAPYLLDALSLRLLGEEEFSLERYATDFPPEEATTIQLEAVRALAAVASPGDGEVLRMLRHLAARRVSDSLDSRVVREARHAVETIEGARR